MPLHTAIKSLSSEKNNSIFYFFYFAGVAKFDPATGKQFKASPSTQSYTTYFAEALTAEAEADKDIVAIHAAMGGGTGLNLFLRRFPTRCFDVGIAEQHAVTFAAGLACEGLKPFCAIYSSFLQRAYDQASKMASSYSVNMTIHCNSWVGIMLLVTRHWAKIHCRYCY